MVPEMVLEQELQPKAFMAMPLVWTIGGLVGPIIGGYPANTAKIMPSLFGHNHFFLSYPFALPNLVVGIIYIIGFVVCYLYLELSLSINPSWARCNEEHWETHAEKRHDRNQGRLVGKWVEDVGLHMTE